MVDNAQPGWIVMREVSWGGEVQLEKKRSNAFHWQQSVIWYTKSCIKKNKRIEHVALLQRCKDNNTLKQAMEYQEELHEWWRKHAIEGKFKELCSWLCWWIVRMRQWGNFMRQGLSNYENALCPNTSGAVSDHSS